MFCFFALFTECQIGEKRSLKTKNIYQPSVIILVNYNVHLANPNSQSSAEKFHIFL